MCVCEILREERGREEKGRERGGSNHCFLARNDETDSSSHTSRTPSLLDKCEKISKREKTGAFYEDLKIR